MDVDANDGAPEESSAPEEPHAPEEPRALEEPDVADEPSAPAGAEASDPTHAQQDGVPFVEHFPLRAAGLPISDMDQDVPEFQALRDNLGVDNIWHPFQLQRDWDFALWAKNRGPSSTAVTELLAINGVRT